MNTSYSNFTDEQREAFKDAVDNMAKLDDVKSAMVEGFIAALVLMKGVE